MDEELKPLGMRYHAPNYEDPLTVLQEDKLEELADTIRGSSTADLALLGKLAEVLWSLSSVIEDVASALDPSSEKQTGQAPILRQVQELLEDLSLGFDDTKDLIEEDLLPHKDDQSEVAREKRAAYNAETKARVNENILWAQWATKYEELINLTRRLSGLASAVQGSQVENKLLDQVAVLQPLFAECLLCHRGEVFVKGEGAKECEHCYGTGRKAPLWNGSAWEVMPVSKRSFVVGWTKLGEFACPYCHESFGKNLNGMSPFLLVGEHLAAHKSKADATRLTLCADFWCPGCLRAMPIVLPKKEADIMYTKHERGLRCEVAGCASLMTQVTDWK